MNYSNQSHEKNFVPNQINFNSINCFSNNNNDNTISMNIETEKDDPTDSNQSNQTNYYSSLQEEDQKIKKNISNNSENNLFIFNNRNEINYFSINSIKFSKNENKLLSESNRFLSNFNQNSSYLYLLNFD